MSTTGEEVSSTMPDVVALNAREEAEAAEARRAGRVERRDGESVPALPVVGDNREGTNPRVLTDREFAQWAEDHPRETAGLSHPEDVRAQAQSPLGRGNTDMAARGLESQSPEQTAAAIKPSPVVEINELQEALLDDATRAKLAARRAHDRAMVEEILQDNGKGSESATANKFGERFFSDLDRRMAEAQIGELGWKGRTELTELIEDLRAAAGQDHERTEQMWKKYRPQDAEAPPFLEDREKSEAARRSASQRAERDEEPVLTVPEAVRKRFIQAEDRYYFREGNNDLAFRDKGQTLATKHDDPMVAMSMVQLADSKGWDAIVVTGSQDFKLEAWLQASLRGMEVRGFTPRDVDKAKLAEMQKELGVNDRGLRNTITEHQERQNEQRRPQRQQHSDARETPVEKSSVVDEQRRSLTPQHEKVLETVEKVWRARGASDREVEIAKATTIERFQNQRVYMGKVVEFGAAPYEHDSKNERSYYVKLQRPEGEKVVWGVDLQRALESKNIQVGDEVVVANQGHKTVPVKVVERDAGGKVTGTAEHIVKRNTWEVDTIDSFREDARDKLAKAAERAERAPVVTIHDRDAPRANPRPAYRPEKTTERDEERTR